MHVVAKWCSYTVTILLPQLNAVCGSTKGTHPPNWFVDSCTTHTYLAECM